MTEDVTITLIIPTRDHKRPLGNAIKSFLDQKAEGDELLIGIDAHSESVENIKEIERTINSFNAYPSIRYFIFDMGHNCWGHCIVNNLMKNARGDFLTFMDDDDILAPNAFELIKEVVARGQRSNSRCPCCGAIVHTVGPPCIFKTFSPIDNRHLWFEKDLLEGGVGGGQIVTPNIPGLLGKWTCRYVGDCDFVIDTISKWGGNFEWREEVIKHVRVAVDSDGIFVPSTVSLPTVPPPQEVRTPVMKKPEPRILSQEVVIKR